MLDTSETEKGRTHMQTIGFIGTGIMGQGMIRNLMKAGYPVQIYNRTRSKAEALERRERSGRTQPPSAPPAVG